MLAKIKALSTKQIVAGAASAAFVGAVGFAGVTHAAPAGKPTKEQCAAAGYPNYGQCVKQWAHSKGYGYGG